jgi:hypothetical protein
MSLQDTILPKDTPCWDRDDWLPNDAPFNPRHRDGFRYAAICNGPEAAGAGSAGLFFVQTEGQNNDTSDDQTEPGQFNVYSRFVHELGHTMGLSHGGDADVNWKPNYPSLMNYSYDFDLGGSPRTLQGTAIQFSPGVLPPIDEINGVPEVNWFGGSSPTFLTSCDGNPFNVSGGNVDWNKNGSYSGTVAQILRIVTGCPCMPPTTPLVLVDINDANWMDANMALMVPGAGDAGEQGDGDGNLNVSDAVKGIDRNDKEGLTRAIRGALERRDAERGLVDVNAIRQARRSEKAAAFKARNGVTELPSCEKH